MTTTSPHTTYAQGLRQLADFLDRHPEYAEWFHHTFTVAGVNLHLRAREQDVAAALERFTQDVTAAGGAVTEQKPPYDDVSTFMDIYAFLGDVKLHPLVTPEDVCERVQIGTRTITETVPDPDFVPPQPVLHAPMIKVTREEPVYQWVCAEDAL